MWCSIWLVFLEADLNVMIAILLYDTLITLDVEVEVVWSRKLSILGFLHVFNRYTAIVAFIEALILLFPVSDSVSSSTHYVPSVVRH